MYTCGLTVYARGHIGNFRTFVALDVLRRALEFEAGYGVRQVMQLHRRRRPHDRRIAEGRPAAARVHPAVHRRVPRGRGRGSGSSRSRSRRARPTTRTSRAMAEHDPGARAERTHLYAATARSTSRSRRCRTTASWRGSITAGSRAARASTRTSTTRKTRAISCSGRRAGPASRPWDPGLPARTAGLAHRVLRDGRCAARRAADRHPRRRRRSDLPAPRERDRAERRRHQQAVLAVLGARRAPDDRGGAARRREDVEVARQRLQPRGHHRRGFRPSALRYLYLGVHYRKQLKFSWTAMAQSEEALKRADRFPGAARRGAGREAGARDGRAARGGGPRVCRAHRRRPEYRRRARRHVRSRPGAEFRASTPARLGSADAARVRETSTGSTACSACSPCAARKTSAPRCRSRRSSSSSRPGARRAWRAQFRRGRSDPTGPRCAWHRARGLRLRRPDGNENDPSHDRARHQDRAAGPQSQGHHRSRQPVRVAFVHARLSASSSRAAKVPSSRTWTATAFSIARPASPSIPPACRIPRSSRRSPSRRRSSSTCRGRTSTTNRRCVWPRNWPRSCRSTAPCARSSAIPERRRRKPR